MLHSTYGRGRDCLVLDTAGVTVDKLLVTNTTPIVVVEDMLDFTFLGYTFQTEDVSTAVVVAANDAVVGSTKTWTIHNFDFTGMSGATIRVSGATNAGNNGDFVIASVTSAHVIVTGGTPADETFSNGTTKITVIRTDVELKGSWALFVGNDHSDSSIWGGPFTRDGLWVDITSSLTPAPPAPVTAPSNGSILVDDFAFGWAKLVFTPTSGQGLLSVYRVKKGSN